MPRACDPLPLNQPIERLSAIIAELDRATVQQMLLAFDRPGLDFTTEFLAGMSTEWMKHVLLAACLRARKPATTR